MKNNNYNSMKMGEFKGRVLQSLNDIKEDINEIKIVTKENSQRITFLEHWKANITGKIGIIVFVVSTIIAFAWDYVKTRFLDSF